MGTKSSRKVECCPYCGREEIVGVESVLVKCAPCAQKKIKGKEGVTGEDIRALRERRGLSARQLARDLRFKVTPSFICQVEKGKKPVNTTLLTWFNQNRGQAESDVKTTT